MNTYFEFILWFVLSTVIIFTTLVLIPNPWVAALLVGLTIAFVATKDKPK